jgi:hypothetical protein
MTLTLLRPPVKDYLPSNTDRLDAIGGHVLKLLAEEPDPLADLVAMVGRKPPPSDGGCRWHGYPRLRPKITAAAGLAGTEARNRQVVQWSMWRLATAGKIELAATPVRGQCGRIRFARLVPPSAAVPTPLAHGWAVPHAYPEASR